MIEKISNIFSTNPDFSIFLDFQCYQIDVFWIKNNIFAEIMRKNRKKIFFNQKNDRDTVFFNDFALVLNKKTDDYCVFLAFMCCFFVSFVFFAAILLSFFVFLLLFLEFFVTTILYFAFFVRWFLTCFLKTVKIVYFLFIRFLS